jgi:hypothetical protein
MVNVGPIAGVTIIVGRGLDITVDVNCCMKVGDTVRVGNITTAVEECAVYSVEVSGLSRISVVGIIVINPGNGVF